MARYGRDFGRWDEEGMGGGGYYGGGDRLGNHWRGGQGGYGRDYGGMSSDAQGYPGWNEGYRGGESSFGTGGGRYDNEYGTGSRRGEGIDWSHGGRLTRGQGGDLYSGSSYGYSTGGGYGRGGSGYDYEPGTGSDWGARDTGYDRGSRMGGGMGRGGGSQQQDDTHRLRAVDIMTENPECVTPDSTLADAAVKMRDLNVGIIPVIDSEQGRRLRGVVTDRDIAIRAVAEGLDARSTRVSDVMTTEVESCNKNDTVGDVLRVMEREQVRRVPITDREGRLVGIVAQADVVRDVDSERGEHRVKDAIEHISEPSRGGGMRGSQSRSTLGRPGGTSGGMTARGGSTSGSVDGSTRRTGSEGGSGGEFGSTGNLDEGGGNL
jgi:CBS domain-containing protein